MVEADGSNETKLTENSGNAYSPTWSPDGTKIAFISYRGTTTYEIYVMDADGCNQTKLTNNSLRHSQVYGEYLAWFP